MNEMTATENKYIVLSLMSALEKSTGSKELAWSAWLEAHKEFVENAPEEIKGLLNNTFRKQIELLTTNQGTTR